MPSAMPEDLDRTLHDIVCDVAELEDIGDDDAFEDHGIDSMMALEIVSEIERSLKLSISEEEVAGVRTLSDVRRIVAGKLRPAA